MKHSEFEIGNEFAADGCLYLCTDKGTRTIAAIRVDSVTVAGTGARRVLNREEAEKEGWFNGPPYAVEECLFDEYDMDGCNPV